MKRIMKSIACGRLTSRAVCFILALAAWLPLTARGQLNYYTETFESLAGWGLGPVDFGSATVTWESAGGNPGGYLRLEYTSPFPTEFQSASFETGPGANLAFTGDLWDRGGGSGLFSFDFRADNDLPGGLYLSLTGAGEIWTATIDLTGLSVGTWQNYVVPLDYLLGGWSPLNPVNDSAGGFVTSMESVTLFEIRPEYDPVAGGTFSFSLDNVSTVVPEPASFALIIAGIAGLRLARRRSQK